MSWRDNQLESGKFRYDEQTSEEKAPMLKQWIESNLAVMMGKPVIAGTRITVALVLQKLAAGETVDQVLDAHPRLTREAIWAISGISDANQYHN
jgi:uncharacterized protein (DUF433 family)